MVKNILSMLLEPLIFSSEPLICVCVCVFLGTRLSHKEVPRLGFESEL